MFYGILKENPITNGNRSLIGIFTTPLSILSEPQGVTVESINFKRYGMEQAVQRWVIEAGIVPQDEPPDIFSDRLVNGDTGDIYIQMPQPYSRNNRQITGTPRIRTAAAKGARKLETTGTFIPNVFICIGSYPSKVYLITSVNSTAQTIDIYPGLKNSMNIDTPIFHSENVIMHANYDNSVIKGVQYDNGILANLGTLKLVEVI